MCDVLISSPPPASGGGLNFEPVGPKVGGPTQRCPTFTLGGEKGAGRGSGSSTHCLSTGPHQAWDLIQQIRLNHAMAQGRS